MPCILAALCARRLRSHTLRRRSRIHLRPSDHRAALRTSLGPHERLSSRSALFQLSSRGPQAEGSAFVPLLEKYLCIVADVVSVPAPHGATIASVGIPPMLMVPVCRMATVSITKMLCFFGTIA